jgi:hypothetical protein
VTGLTGETLTLDTDRGERRFTSATIRTVAARRYSLGRGALIGFGVLTIAAVSAPNCRSNPDCQPLAAGAMGAGLGLAVGALMPRMAPVYSTSQAHVALSPLMSPRAVGMRATVRW